MATATHATHEAGLAQAASGSETSGATVDALEGEYEAILQGLRATFVSGKTKSLEWRLGQLEALRLGIVANMDAIVDALKNDLGRHDMEAVMAEALSIKGEIDHCKANLEQWMTPDKVWHPMMAQPGSSQIVHDPKGVVLVLAPWNYPINLAFMSLIAVICGGNAAVVKPSEVAVHSAVVIENIINDFMDTDAIRVVQGAVPETTALLRLRWDHIIYTGNGAVGRIVMRAAAQHLTPVTLELGGKSPVFIDKSCNIAVSAKRLLAGKTLNNGQTCIAPDYVLLHESIERDFVKEMVSVLHGFFGEDPMASPSFGRVINQRHWDRLARLLDPASHGGEVLVGGLASANRDECYIPPTIILNPALDSELMTEEIFGWILPVVTVKDTSEALEIINAREHPLALYCYAEDSAVCDRFVNETTSGGVCLNDSLMHITNPYLPFGGVGASGMGAYHGEHGFKEMTHQKAVMNRPTWIDPGIRYPPYTTGKADALRNLVTSEGMSPLAKKVLTAAGIGAVGLAVLSKL